MENRMNFGQEQIDGQKNAQATHPHPPAGVPHPMRPRPMNPVVRAGPDGKPIIPQNIRPMNAIPPVGPKTVLQPYVGGQPPMRPQQVGMPPVGIPQMGTQQTAAPVPQPQLQPP
ncbi:hypothetical protein AX774_g7231, partial [Zancudomyces culisetae]